jgi:hypothetical protein
MIIRRRRVFINVMVELALFPYQDEKQNYSYTILQWLEENISDHLLGS